MNFIAEEDKYRQKELCGDCRRCERSFNASCAGRGKVVYENCAAGCVRFVLRKEESVCVFGNEDCFKGTRSDYEKILEFKERLELFKEQKKNSVSYYEEGAKRPALGARKKDAAVSGDR